MNGSEYQSKAMRTNDGKSEERLRKNMSNFNTAEIIHGALGLSGEVGEVNDLLKKWIFHEKPLDIEHMEKEIGDVMWYIAMICHGFGFNLDKIMQMNVDKLLARYPEGFDTERANNRKEGDI